MNIWNVNDDTSYVFVMGGVMGIGDVAINILCYTEAVDRKVQAVRVKLHKPTVVHLIKVHLKSPWKVGYEDSQKIVASLTKAADNNQWTINQDIVVNKPETGDKKVFSILYENPITLIDVCKNYNVVLIDHLYMIASKNNKKRLDLVTSPMLLMNGNATVVGFNLFGPDEPMMKQKRKIELEHAGSKIKKIYRDDAIYTLIFCAVIVTISSTIAVTSVAIMSLISLKLLVPNRRYRPNLIMIRTRLSIGCEIDQSTVPAPVSTSTSTPSSTARSDNRQPPPQENATCSSSENNKNRQVKHFDLKEFRLNFVIPDNYQKIEISMHDIHDAYYREKAKLPSQNDGASVDTHRQRDFWMLMYNFLFEAFESNYNEFLMSRRKFLGIIDTVLFSLVTCKDDALDNLQRMRRYLAIKTDSESTIRIKSAEKTTAGTSASLQEKEIDDFCEGSIVNANYMKKTVVHFFSMSEILQNISAPEDIAFTGIEFHENFPMPIKFDKDRKVQAVRVKLHKPTLVHLIKVHLKSPWKVGHEDSKKIVASLTKAADNNQWTINQDIVVNKPETGDKKVFSILYKNPITLIDVCKNYNVVLIDHLYMIASKNNKKRLDLAVRVKLHKPTVVHLIKVHLKSPWKVGYEDSQKIVASLTKAADNNQWTINQDIVVNKPETGDKKVFSILYENPITLIDVCKNYNVVLIDHLYMVVSKNNKNRLDLITSPMLLMNGNATVVGFNLFGSDVATMKQKRKIVLEHAVLEAGSKMKKRKLNK
ncbi:hypothetical protein TSAR_009802 [Trichomalopsis sarcophagae]|uniref:Uncharacterized protein n=1 Tax=Trichomalopsis sarcophagae TaxID=543379 RepID=A0A232FDS3_9HYME|nr:hypothetical protein TSAR_009802 [Trichomalopsis sarcophagae]